MLKKNTTPFFWGVIICLAGAICFSTKAIFVKLAYRDTQVDAISLLVLRMIFSLPFFLISAGVYSSKENNVKFTTKQWIYIAVIGCLGYYVSSLLDFLGLQFVTAGIERLILFIYPTLVLLMNSVLFKQKIKGIQWLAVAVTYTGLLLAFFGEVDFSAQNENFIWGSFLIFICAITYAAYIVGSGKLIPLVGAVKFNSYAMSFACIGVFLHFFATSEQSLMALPSQVYIYGLLMAILSTVIPSYLVSIGINRIGAGNAAIVASVGPVSTILLAYYFLNESIFVMQVVGTAMILFGVLLISRGKADTI
jgi:drug/metabolite transporter (DMT)-like permease